MLKTFIERFIPDSARQDPANYKRAHGIIALALGLFVWWPIFAGAYFYYGAPLSLCLFVLLSGFLYLLNPLLLLKTQSFLLSINLLAIIPGATLAAVSYADGGIRSQAVLVLICLPIIPICFGARRSGVLWMFAVIAYLAWMLWLKRSGHAFDRVISSEGDDLLWFISLVCAVTTITGVIASYEKVRNDLYKVIIVRARELEEKNDVILAQQKQMIESSKMAALGEMAGGIAHEINNPLAILQIGMEQLGEIVRKRPIDEDMEDMIELVSCRVFANIKRIAKIVAGLRHFSRRAEQDPSRTVPVRQLVASTLDFCGERLKVRQIGVHVEEIPDGLAIDCRDIQIEQTLLNLLNNACDAVSELPEKWVRIQVSELDSSVRIAVVDSGRGISPEIQDQIFEPFFTTKEAGKGTGLGLSISKGIIESHGGRLTLDRHHPHTRFVVDLPKGRAPTPAHTPSASPTGPDPSELRDGPLRPNEIG